MNRFLKTLLIWILIAVVPLHAVAATVGMSCAPGHQQVMQVAMSHDPAPAMSDDTGHHHDAADGTGSASDAAMSANMASDQADPPAHATHSTCSACPAFCMGAAAPPSAVVSIPSFSGSENVIVSAAPRVAGFIPEGLRRPPRQISA
jgi:hypothetical protein